MIIAWDSPDPVEHAIRVQTGSDGVASASQVPLGTATVYTDRSENTRALVERGVTSQVELALPAGHLVSGTVVDLEGNPVRDAQIWLSGFGNHLTGAVVATGGADGAFELPGVGAGYNVGARAPGHAPSLLHHIEGEGGEPVTLRLTLQGQGGTVGGTVTGPAGAPIPDAVVVLKEPSGIEVRHRTDRDGRFRFVGVETGNVHLEVRRHPLVPWLGTAVVLPDRDTQVAVRLAIGGSLVGVVRDSEGRPVADAHVTARAAGGRPKSSVSVRPDGTYALRGLAPGEHTAFASSRAKGTVQASVRVGLEGPTEWNPVFSDGLVIRGRVVDAGGAPLVGWGVQGTERAGVAHVGDFYGGDATDAEGRFRIRNCPARPLRLIVCEPDGWGEPVLVRPGVEAGDEEITLTVPDDARPSAFLSGSIVGPDGRPANGAEAILFDVEAEGGHAYPADAATGRFRIGPLRPGRYRLTFRAEDFPYLPYSTHAVAAKAEVELSPARFLPAGRVVLRVTRTDGNPVAGVEWWLRAAGAEEADPGHTLTRRRDGLLTRPIAAGSYILRVTASGCEELEVSVEVRAGAETPVDLTLRPAAGD